MNNELKRMLYKNGYIFIEKEKYVIIKKRVVKSVGQLLVFTIIGGLIFGLALIIMTIEAREKEFAFIMLVLGLVLMAIPFYGYLSSPYRGLVIDTQDKTILFRAKWSRAYKFSEVDSLEIISRQSDGDTNPFSNSNKEYSYYINILLAGNTKEELFRLVSTVEIDDELKRLKSLFIDLLS